MTLRQLFSELTQSFQKLFEDPRLEARHLLLEALQLDLNQLVLREEAIVSAADIERIEFWKKERLKGVPLAYLSGRKFFWKDEFLVRPGVLIPRPETEFVVEVALTRASEPLRLADLGSGTGCIGLSLLKEWPTTKLFAVERSQVAAETSQQNAKKLGLEDRAMVLNESVEDWNSEFAFDVIVANPPYISYDDPRVEKSVHTHEPHEALYSEDQGLAAIRSWAMAAWKALSPGGLIVFEFGSGQTESVQEIIKRIGFRDIQVIRDLSGIERVISATKPE